jgi:Zn-dependent protease
MLLPLAALNAPDGSRAVAVPFSIVWLLAVFVCVLLHEFGHALTARSFGIATRDIILYPIGGVARLERLNDRPFEELVIALAGPAVNVLILFLLTPVLFAFTWAGGLHGPTLTVNLSDGWLGLAAKFTLLVWFSNLVLVLFNLIPAFPMDGGRVLRAVLAHFLGQLRGTEIAARVGLFMAGCLVALTLFGMSQGATNPMPLLVSAFVVYAGQLELLATRQREQCQRHELAGWPGAPLPGSQPAPGSPMATELARLRPYRPGFTGITWDGRHGLWVRWHDGQAVAAYSERTV